MSRRLSLKVLRDRALHGRRRLAAQVRDGVTTAFDGLGGDLYAATNAAEQSGAIQPWVRANALRVSASGASMAAIPGVHLGTLGFDVAYLIRRMSITAWGIGAILGVGIHGRQDMEAMLRRWSGMPDDAEGDDQRRAIKSLLSEQGIEIVDEVLAAILVRAIAMHEAGMSAPMVAEQLEGWIPDPLGVKLGGKKVGAKAIAKGSEKLVAKGMAKMGTKWFLKSSAKIGGKLAEKLAVKVAAKLVPKLALKVGSGGILFVGAGISGAVNAWLVRDFARVAQAHYQRELAALGPRLALPPVRSNAE